uniref:Alpha-L-fucosidase n=1 Tax=Kalanchoe fedtschenkoi TaxID=63787 RepID=A0A7N0VKJ0_KALFE
MGCKMAIHKLSPPATALLLMSLLVLLLSNPASCLHAHCQIPAIFNFGDSNSDTGGLSAAFGQAPYPNGETFFRSPAGRFSDGRLIIDFIAEGTGLPYLSPYLDSMSSNFSHGANFATAGSTIRPQNTTMAQSGYSPISLDVQFVQFKDFHARSKQIRQRGGIFATLLPKEEYFSHALYTFDIGQNDLTAGYKLNMSTEQVKAYVPDLLDQLSRVIKGVYDEGGRSFWIHNTGPVGCLPYVLDRFLITAAQVDPYGCATPYNEVAQHFNSLLKESLAKLRKDLPLAHITYVDVYSLKYTLITHASNYGFEGAIRACCGHGGKYNYNRFAKCGAKINSINGTQTVVSRSCKDPAVYVNWDGTHFTEAANKWVFNRVAGGSFSDPPTRLIESCGGTTSGSS